jgi:hypothetical protein
VKILLLGDTHLSERPPSSCTDSYCDDLFDLLKQARGVGIDKRVAAMAWAGDTFHHKAPNRVSHRLVQRTSAFIDTCTPYFPVLILAGNHDMANDRYDSVFESQPLGMLYRAGAHELKGWHPELPVYGVPWLQGYGEYTEESDTAVGMALREYREQISEGGTGQHRPLVITHAPLYPQGKELKYEYFPVGRWAEAMGSHAERGEVLIDGSHRVFYGHVHEPHGTHGFYDATGDATFCNNGALSRGSLHEYNLTRQVGVTIYDTIEATFEFVPLNARPASEVFRLEEKGRVTDLQGRMAEFLEGVGSTSLEVMSVEAVVAHIRSQGLGADVEALAEELLAEAQHGKGNQRPGA